MQFFDSAATRAALGFDRLIPALRELFASGCEVPARHVHTVGDPGGGAMTLLLMPAWQPGGCLGLKTVAIAPGNAARGLPGLHSTYLLFDARTGVPLAQMDGDEITSRRTAAASALAASFLAPPQASRLLVLGSGRVASLLPQAYREVRGIARVDVWSRHADHARALAARLAGQGFDAHAVADLAGACAQADIVSCATLSTQPLVRGEWLQPGSHLDLIGSFTPEMREADDACLQGAALYVDTLEALCKSGDLAGPLARGLISEAGVAGTLERLCRDGRPGEGGATRTVFKSVGTALEDLAAALQVWRAASGKA
jgi:ornithine cyclodeaminase